MANLRGNKTPKKSGSPAKQVSSTTKSPMKLASKTPARTPGRPPKTPKPSPKNTPMSRKRELTEEPTKEENEEMLNKKLKQTPKARKSTPAMLPEVTNSEDDASDDEELELNITNQGAVEDSSSDDEEHSAEEEDDDSEDKTKAPNKGNKKKDRQMFDTPTVMVRHFKTNLNSLKEHFQSCGVILTCNKSKDKRSQAPKAFIKFKDIAAAQCAVATLNDKPFQGRKISVEIVKAPYLFSKETTVCINDLPQTKKSKTLYDSLRIAMKKFGNVVHVKFSPDMKSAKVQYEDNSGCSAALKAKSIDLMGSQLEILQYGEFVFEIPDQKIILHGLSDDTTLPEIQKAIPKSFEVLSTYYPNGKNGKPLKNQIFVSLKTVEQAEKCLALKTIKIKNVDVDVLPHNHNKMYQNKETNVYYKHPAGLFIENLPQGDFKSLLEELNKLGPVQRFSKIYGSNAVVFFEQKADAQKVLKTKPQLLNETVTYHAVDGTYAPAKKSALDVAKTLFISNIAARKNVTDLLDQVKALNLKYSNTIAINDPITRAFKNAVIIEMDNENSAKQLLATKLTVADKLLNIEMYKPAKHERAPANLVVIENLTAETKEVDLWKSFQRFGQITKTEILQSINKGAGCGYIEFDSVDVASKVLKAKNVEINGNKIKVIKPTAEHMEKIRKEVSAKFSTKHNKNFKPKGKFAKSPKKSPNTFKKTSTFKKKTFKKNGAKPRRSL